MSKKKEKKHSQPHRDQWLIDELIRGYYKKSLKSSSKSIMKGLTPAEIYNQIKLKGLKPGDQFRVKLKGRGSFINATYHEVEGSRNYFICANASAVSHTGNSERSPNKYGFKYSTPSYAKDNDQYENTPFEEIEGSTAATEPLKRKSSTTMLKTVQVGKVFTNNHTVKVIESVIETNQPALLVGETGTGKTSLLRELVY